MVGRPESRRFWLPLTTPASGLPFAPMKIFEASKPESVTVRKVSLREKPKRNSLSRVGLKVCVSVKTMERLTAVLEVPPSQGRTPAVRVGPRYSAQRPDSRSLSPRLWSILISSVLSKVEAPTLAMKLMVEPGVAEFAAGQNWRSAFEIGSVTWARSASVGTRVELTVGFTWRKRSQEPKKNVLSRRIGPPR